MDRELLTNHDAISFGAVAESTIFLKCASVIWRFGRDGERLIWTGNLVHARTLAVGDPIFFTKDSIVVPLPEDMPADNFYTFKVLLGTADMGPRGRLNEPDDAGYFRQRAVFRRI